MEIKISARKAASRVKTEAALGEPERENGRST